MKKLLLAIVLTLCTSPISAWAEGEIGSWYLPTPLSDANTTVRFEVDSTWHLVEDTTADLTGAASLTDTADPHSIQVSLKLPVAKFDTDNGSRDESMREVMFADKYPSVTFMSTKPIGKCTPALVLRDKSCDDVLTGNLTIVNTTTTVNLPVHIASTENKEFVVTGSLPIRWAEYGVEDPSIFIARLKPVVTVFFTVTLKPGS